MANAQCAVVVVLAAAAAVAAATAAAALAAGAQLLPLRLLTPTVAKQFFLRRWDCKARLSGSYTLTSIIRGQALPSRNQGPCVGLAFAEAP